MINLARDIYLNMVGRAYHDWAARTSDDVPIPASRENLEMSYLRFVVFAIICSIVSLSAALAQSSKPVSVGGEASLDACGGVGAVIGLDPRGDNFLAVRSGPGAKYKMIDKLHAGQMFFDCDAQGKWIGIVYSRKPNAACGVSSPVRKRQAYRGPCRSGWIFKKYTKLIAG